MSPKTERMLALFFILSQALSTHTADQPKRPPEVLALVDQARALPPEFRADTLLRLSDSPLIKETAWKQELIEEAFWSGAHAPLPYPQWGVRAGPKSFFDPFLLPSCFFDERAARTTDAGRPLPSPRR